MAKPRFMIIDGNALLHRAFHALPPLSTKDGKLVNAVYGFTTVLMKALRELKPAYVAVTFDLPGPTFRDELYKEYKAQRVKQPQELYDQLPMIKEVVRAFNIPVVEKVGFEADDVIATLSRKLEIRNLKLETIIVTGDMDTLQLVDEHTKVYSFRKGFSDTVIYDEAAVKEKYGLRPDQMVDYKSLRGDPSDNIPGVRGIGEKTASELLVEFGSVEKLYFALEHDNTETLEQKGVKRRIQDILRTHKKDALLGKQLVELKHEVPLTVKLADCKVKDPDTQKLRELFEGFEFKNLVKRLDEGQGSKIQNLKPTAQKALFETTHPAKPLTPLDKQIQVAAYLLNLGDRSRTLESIGRQYDLTPDEPEKVLAKLCEDLKKQDLLALYENIEKPLIKVLEKMENVGIKVDVVYLTKLSGQFGKELKELEKKIYKLSGQEFNIASPVQMREILYDKLGLVPQVGRIKKTVKGKVASTAAGELGKLRGAHPIVDLIFDYRELAKLKSTYTDALPALVKKDGRIHTSFNQTVTATGRLSSSEPNLQNIPIRTENGRLIRKAFIAEKGFVLLSADYSQIELRVAASLSGDEEMIKAFQSGHDFHSETAARVFEVKPEKVDHEMRRRAKAINFGIIYGMGATALAQAMGTPRSDAEQFIERYFEIYNALYAFLEGQKQHARDHGYVATLFGRRRYLPEINSGVQQVRAAAERMATNMPVQGSAADLMKLAMIRLHQTLSNNLITQSPNNSIRMLLQVHDELVFEVEKDLVDKVAPKIKEIMESVYKLKVPIVVDLKQGDNWGELESIV
ncbi:DNA polymerase I [Candidatus Uhrbacteria bacterium]|nr:DNA polymerase I [Candidatus Uhrbacteria bacterium]